VGLALCGNCDSGSTEVFHVQRKSSPGIIYRRCAKCLIGTEDITQFEFTESVKPKKEEEEW